MKYLYSIFLILIFTIFISSNSFAQHKLDSKEAKEFKQLNEKLEGHYQIQVINSRKEPLVNYEMLKAIESKLDDKKSESFYYKPNLKIILSSSDSREFLEEKKVTYISK